MDYGCIESRSGKLDEKRLAVKLFEMLLEAKVLIE
jgi:hypothetical protein